VKIPPGTRDIVGVVSTDKTDDVGDFVVSDDVLATLVRAMGDAVLIADAEGRIVFWNDAATRLFGWPREEALGQRLDLIIPERLRQRHWDGWTKAMATGTTKYGDQLLEVPAVRRDGQPISIAFSVSLFTGPSGAVDGVAAVLRDDTEHFQQRRATRDEIAGLRAALEEARSS
jgi:PAS domain S-box-containing protein